MRNTQINKDGIALWCEATEVGIEFIYTGGLKGDGSGRYRVIANYDNLKTSAATTLSETERIKTQFEKRIEENHINRQLTELARRRAVLQEAQSIANIMDIDAPHIGALKGCYDSLLRKLKKLCIITE